MSQDELFRRPRTLIDDFDFGPETAEVFDDMLARSIPLYSELQRMIAELAADFAQGGTTVYDLGCSTGTTLATLDRALPDEVHLVGIDSSPDMLNRARVKLQPATAHRPVELLCLDLERGVPVRDASLVVMILTLQFIRPLRREAVIADIAKGLVERGALILVEKVLGGNSLVNRLFIEHYYDFKRRNGFRERRFRRYYVPLTVKGHLAIKTGLHLGLRRLLPASVVSALRESRRKLWKTVDDLKADRV